MYKIKCYFRKSSLSFLVIKPSFDMIYYWKCLSCSSSRNNITITLKTCTLLIFLTKLLTHFKKKTFWICSWSSKFIRMTNLISGNYSLKSVGSSGICETKSELMMYNADSVNNSSVSKKLRPWARKDYLTGYFLQIVKFFFIRNLWISLPILLVVEFPNLLAC